MTSTTTDSTSSDARQAAKSVAEDAKDKAVDVRETATSEARSVARDVKGQAADIVGTTRGQLREQAAEQTKTLASTMRDIGDQLGGMADNADDPHAQVAQLAKSAADSLSTRAQRLDEGGLDELVGDLKRFARNRPGAFLLGSVAIGFGIGRLAKHADLGRAGEAAKNELDTDAITQSSSTSDSSPAALSAPALPTSGAPSDLSDAVVSPTLTQAPGLVSDGRP